jgi:hypothetical protein
MPMNDTTLPPWQQPGWLERATAWIDEQLDRLGVSRAGEIAQPHERPWSLVLGVPTAAGHVYFKAVAPQLAHEVRLTQLLARWRPSDVLPLLAADTRRAWMLLPDGGQQLRGLIRADHDIRHWERLLPAYAELQIGLSERAQALLEAHVPDRRLATLPGRLAGLLSDERAIGLGHGDGLSAGEAERLRALSPRIERLCHELAAAGLPESIHHGDLHDGNIFIGQGGGHHYRFFDWGDASLSHPFFSLRTAYVSAEISLDLPEGAPELERLRDAYLEPWGRYAPLAELRRALAAAMPLAALCGALAWNHALSALDEQGRQEYAVPVPALLRELLQGVEVAP